MSLRIIADCRIEELAEKLVAGLKSERAGRGRFEFLKVSVANPNLGNWLKMKVLAKVPEHELAYAMTVHKSQGSEFENVLVVLPNDANHPLLNRQIVYTGLTRARKRAVVIGSEASLKAALTRKLERNTGVVV